MDVTIVLLGLSAPQESEGFGREDIELLADQLRLPDAVAAAQRRVVVFQRGGVVRLAPVVAHAPGILDGALLGQGGGAALAATLFGRDNPSGTLTETAPARIEDSPAYLVPWGASALSVQRRAYVGYQRYDARAIEVTYPFGHGLL